MMLQLLRPGTDTPPQSYPLFSDLASCGFPSPAQDYVESDLDLHDYCIRHPSATYYLRASGDSMSDGSLFDFWNDPCDRWDCDPTLLRSHKKQGTCLAFFRK